MSGTIDVDRLGSLVVDAGNLFVFDRSIDVLTRSDALDSDLLSQLAADKQASRLEDPSQWFAKYQDALSKLFWRNNSFGLEGFEPDTADFLIAPILLKLFMNMCSRGELDSLEQNLTKFSDLSPEARGATIYDGFTQNERMVCVTASFVRSPVEMVSVSVSFATGQPIARSFRQIFQTALLETKIAIATYSRSLNEMGYAKIREDIRKKLGPRKSEYVIEIT